MQVYNPTTEHGFAAVRSSCLKLYGDVGKCIMVGSVIVFIFAAAGTVGFVIAFRVTYFLVAGVSLAVTATCQPSRRWLDQRALADLHQTRDDVIAEMIKAVDAKTILLFH